MKTGLSIIICTLNEEKNIGNILDELVSIQGVHNILIIDGGSVDRTKEITEKYEKVKFVLKANVGLLRQRIHAIDIIDTEYFAFIDADDLISSKDLNSAFEYLKMNNLDGVQFKTTSRIQNNNYWQKVWAAYFKLIYVENRKINMLGRPCIARTFHYKKITEGISTIPISMEDTYLDKLLFQKYGILNYKVVPYFSYRLCENTIKQNFIKWIRYGKGDAQITTSLTAFISSFHHLIFRILIFRSIKTLFSKNYLYFPGVLLFATARLAGFLTNVFYHKKNI